MFAVVLGPKRIVLESESRPRPAVMSAGMTGNIAVSKIERWLFSVFEFTTTATFVSRQQLNKMGPTTGITCRVCSDRIEEEQLGMEMI